MPTQESRQKIDVENGTLQKGDKICRTAAKKCFSQYLWIANNLPGEQRTAICALLNHVVRSADYLDLESADGLPLDVWCEFRDDLSDAFQDNFASADLVSLVHVFNKYNVPRQFLFDTLDGVDDWIRHRGFETFEDLLVFAYRMGGAPLAASVPICGFIKSGYEDAAIKAGQAVFLTHVMANVISDIKLNKIYFAKEDLDETELSISRVKVRQSSPELKHLIRIYGARVEKLMYEGGKLIEYLDFDARRSFTSLMAMNWSMLMKMRLDPESVLNPDGVLTRREMFGLKTKHVLGLEGKIPVIPQLQHH